MTVEERTELDSREDRRVRRERRRWWTLLGAAVAALILLFLGVVIGRASAPPPTSHKYSATVHFNSLPSSIHSSPAPYHFSISIHNNGGARTLEHPYIVLDYNDALDVGTRHRVTLWQNAYSVPGPVKAGATVKIRGNVSTDYPGSARIQVLVFGDRSNLGSYAGRGAWAGTVTP